MSMRLSNALMLASVLVCAMAAVCARESGDETVLERAHDLLQAALRERHPEVERFELTPIGASAAMWRQMKTASFEFVVPDEASFGKRQRVVIRYRHTDGNRRESTIWWSIKAFRTVVVARSLIRANEMVREDDIVMQSVDVAGLASPIGEFRLVGSNRKSRRFIPAGTPLLDSDMDSVPEVTREQQVKVKVGTGSVLVETIGVATEQGRIGDVILVANPASKMRYAARVTAAGEVTVGGWPQ